MNQTALTFPGGFCAELVQAAKSEELFGGRKKRQIR